MAVPMKNAFGMWRRVGRVRTDVSQELVASILKVERMREIETMLDSFHPEDRGHTFFRNVRFSKTHTALDPRRRHSAVSLFVGGTW
jgi:hypothetical protein